MKVVPVIRTTVFVPPFGYSQLRNDVRYWLNKNKGIEESTLTMDEPWYDVMDSFDLVELIEKLEKKFPVTMPTDYCETLHDLCLALAETWTEENKKALPVVK